MRGAQLAVLVGLAGCNQLLGIEDPPGDDRCIGPCACRIDDDCGVHEYCNDQIKSRTCDCVAGYARGEASCTWEGAVLDPGFADVAAWLTVKTASVDGRLATPELKDPGVLRLPRGACGAAALQRVVMPRLARAEPLAAVMTYRIPDPVFLSGAGPAFGIGRIWSEGGPAATRPQWITERRCLGAGHYAAADSTGRGEEVQLSVGRTIDGACAGESVEVDRFTIVRADPGECPPPGPVVNGLADEADGWMFTTAAGGLGGFVAGVGENASRGAKLTLQQRCSVAAVDVPLAPPLADGTGGAMLSYYAASSTASTSVRGSLGPRILPAIPALQPTIVRFCVPAYLRGGADRLRVAPSYDVPGGLCTDLIGASAVLDTVKLETALACGADPAIADPGFESGTLAQTSATGTASVRSLESAAAVHAGTHALELRLASCPPATTTSAAASVHVVTPTPDSVGGPALSFWWQMDLAATATLQVVLNDATGGGLPTLARTQEWRQGLLCLDPKLAGRRREVSFQLSATTCAAPQRALIDDLAAVTDPACPAQ
jgi:hypothetical protein